MIMPMLIYERKKKMVGFRLYLLALVFSCMLFSPMGFTKSVNLKTIKVNLSTNFGQLQTEIHFDDRDIDVALKAKKIIEKDLIKVINYFEYVPRNIVHFNLNPYLRLTNGSATTFPTSTVNLYNFPADNSSHLIGMQDWLRGLMVHEFTHITHLDQTRGYLEIARNIFGSIANIPAGITPRWFVEGIAVWSESHLFEDGRLNNSLFRKELLVEFLNKEYCDTIDCLDEPGVYPGSQLAYWAGAHFIEYIESKKPGAVKCLVQENSGNIPFFLNHTFKTCTGDFAQTLFNEFRENFIKTESLSNDESQKWGENISNAFGSDAFQKGIFIDGSTLFKVEVAKKSEALVSYDLNENVNMLISKYQHPISDIAGITVVPNADAEQTDQGKFLIVSFNEDPNYRTSNRTWKLINTETLLIEAILPFKNDPSYVIGLGNNLYLTASFHNNKWIIEEQFVEMGAKKVGETKVIHHFDFDVNLTYFKKYGQKIFIKLNRGDLGTALYVSDLKLSNFYNIYESKKYFDFPLINERFLIVKSIDETKFIEIGDDFTKLTTSEVLHDFMNKVTFSETADDKILVLENRLKIKKMSFSDLQTLVKANVTDSIESTPIAAIFQETMPTENLPNTPVESFPRFEHMLPHYWFLATGSSENLFSIGAMTQFSDPMDLNVLNATVLSYPTESKFGGSIDYLHKFSSFSDQWAATAFYNKEYSKTEFSEKINDKTEVSIGTHYQFLLKRWVVVPGLFVGQTTTNDFISSAKVDKVGTSVIVGFNAQSFDDFFQKLTFQTRFGKDMPEVDDGYFSSQTKISGRARFQERIEGGFQTSYSKFMKSNLKGGTIYGGGTTDVSNLRWHEFYGLPYSNAYGNEVFNFRLYLDWNFWYIYRGKGFFPVFLKEAHLIFGREMLTADRIFLAGKRFNNKMIHSFFAGPVLKTNLFYYVPADIEMIFSSIKRPDNGSVNQVELNIKANIF